MFNAVLNKGGLVPEEYNELMFLDSHLSFNSYEQFESFPAEIYNKILDYKLAESDGQKALDAREKAKQKTNRK